MEKKKVILNKVEMIDFLKKESNDYSNFILEKINRNANLLKTNTSVTHKHHIIPKHRFGSDEPFNIILLTTEEHIEAHKLLYSCYNYKEDKAAYQMLSGLIKDGQKTIWTLNQEKMKREKKGFFDPKLQKDLANRPKKARGPRARNEFVIQALYRGIILEHQETKTIFEFFDYVSVIQIATELISHPFLCFLG